MYSRILILLMGTSLLGAAVQAGQARPQDEALARYFRSRVRGLAANCIPDSLTASEWQTSREERVRRLREMLGLDPWPERTDLRAVVTGRVERAEFVVERLHFQSRPGLYVTASFYLPRICEGRLPAILYVCGHGNVKKNGISYGAKASYQHHGAWFARNGYACLILDTLQLGEIEGLHHGTYREGMWWWWSRGYTPAGVEAWNGIRAIDYLQSRREVDPERIGITGRSGGGAYSWWVAAIDERVKAAVPVAGITDLENHVVDGAVEGHCDCMFFVNRYRWDYPEVAALVAPRPLLIANSDKDPIFPLEGVARTHAKVRRVYGLLGAQDRLGLLITEGPHRDTQELQLPALRWFNRFLKGIEAPVETSARPELEPEELRVFAELPADEKNRSAHDWFVPAAPSPELPRDQAEWDRTRAGRLERIRAGCLGPWPRDGSPVALRQAYSIARDGIRLTAWDFTSEPEVTVRLWTAFPEGVAVPRRSVLTVLDTAGWKELAGALRAVFGGALPETAPAGETAAGEALVRRLKEGRLFQAWLAPRGVGPSGWSGDERKQTQIRRRFALVGETLEAGQIWDLCRAIQAVRALPIRLGALELSGAGQAAGIALYAALLQPGVQQLDLRELPERHQDGPALIGVQRVWDLPEAVAAAATPSTMVRLHAVGGVGSFAQQVAVRLKWRADRLVIQ